MPPVPRSRNGGDLTINDSDSFSFQIPGSILHSGENLLAEDDDDFFGGVDVDISTGTAAVPSPLKGQSHKQGHSQITMRRMTRSQSQSPQKQQTGAKMQPPRSVKKSKAMTMSLSSSSSFPASTYQGLEDERLMEVEEMDGMDGMDSMDATASPAEVPVLEPIAAELNKPRSSSRRPKSPSKPKPKSKTQANLNESLASMSAYLPPPSPDVSTNNENRTEEERLHPNAFNFNFSPDAKIPAPAPEPEAERLAEKRVKQLEPVVEEPAQGSAIEQQATNLPADRRIPTSRIERREKRVTSRSKKTDELPTTTTNATNVDVVSQMRMEDAPTSVSPAEARQGSSTAAVAPQPQPDSRSNTHKRPSTTTNPFDALKKRVTSPDPGLVRTESAAEGLAPDSNSHRRPSASVGERLAQYGQKLMGGSVSLFKSTGDSVSTATATNTTATTTTAIKPTTVQALPKETKRDVQEARIEMQSEVDSGEAAPAGVAMEAKREVKNQAKSESKERKDTQTSAVGNDMDVDVGPAAPPTITTTTTMTTTTLPEHSTAAISTKPETKTATTTKPAVKPSSTLPAASKVLTPPPAPPERVAPAPASSGPSSGGTAAVTMAGSKRSAFDALKAGLSDKTKPSASTNASALSKSTANNKKRTSSEAEGITAPGLEAATGTATQPPARKRARRDSVMLGKAAAAAAVPSSSSTRRRSMAPPVDTKLATSSSSLGATSVIAEEPEPELRSAPTKENSDAMDVDVKPEEPEDAKPQVEPEVIVDGAVVVDLLAVSAPQPAAPVEEEVPIILQAPPPPLTQEPPTTTAAEDAAQLQMAEASAAEASRKAAAAVQKRKRAAAEEADAQRKRDEAKREARREQQKVLRKSLAVIAAAAAVTAVGAVVADAEDDEDEHDENGDEHSEDEEEEDRLPAPKFGAPKTADAARKVKVEQKGKAKAETETGELVKGESRKRTRSSSRAAAATRATTSRSAAASSSKTTVPARTATHTLAQAKDKASRKIATNSRINHGGPIDKKEVSSSSSSAGIQTHTQTQTRSRLRAGKTSAASTVAAGIVPAKQDASGASFPASSASSLTSIPRAPFEVPLPATLPGEFAARTEARRDALRREKQRDTGEGGDLLEGENDNTATRSSSRTSTRNRANAKKEKPPIPNFAAMHAAQAALLARAKASLPPLTKPHAPALTTEARMKERAVFDAHIREKEAEEERKREEERRRKEEQEELEVKELRKRTVPKAHEVPEWYRDMPKKAKTVGSGSGEEPSSSTL